jgi:cellulose synthase/poly-beta-1,6-N-acetylglucosamine synthase-like glycosyltransferase
MELILSIILIYLGIWTAYLAFFSVAGLFYRKPRKVAGKKDNTYLILIPSYKEDAVILDTVSANLRQIFNYSRYKLVVIADQLKEQTIAQIEAMGVEVVEVHFEKSTKAKSINYALEHLETFAFTHVVILDADNEMHPEFLNEVDSSLSQDVIALQAHRTAKNSESTTALLDAMNEEIGNHIFRKGHRAVGLSAALIGSGMVFQLKRIQTLNDRNKRYSRRRQDARICAYWMKR